MNILIGAFKNHQSAIVVLFPYIDSVTLKQIIKTEFADATQQESRLFKHQVNELESEIGQIFEAIRKEVQ